VQVREGSRTIRYPENSTAPGANLLWGDTAGVLTRDGRFYLWTHNRAAWGDITIATPLTREYLANLVPNLGIVDLLESSTNRASFGSDGAPSEKIPAAVNRLDNEFSWYATIPMADWERPGKERSGFLVVRSRASAVLSAVFNRKTDLFQSSLQIVLVIGVIVFFIVEIISLVIGVAMTRTITGAVHRLYDGTQRMIEGDFSHRIEVRGRDQLAELSRSFNTMTENLERLLVVAKEKERLQSEIEIAREVQSQLYPRSVPKSESLRVTAICQPARMVSGDYYDYECIRETQVALAIGDVAGKGISAALLMATLQSSLRTQLQSWLEVAAAAGNGAAMKAVSTSRLVSRLNNQLYAYTSPEKYATFCLGVFDEAGSVFSYTNAGHLPPLLVREGVGHRLDVNGTVVGAFPFSIYDESHLELKSGDLLVFFTDGITEPENEYGEMFGEDRLVDLIARNAHRSEPEIVELVLSSVHQWTASEELQDDMTILMARRI
ncbi:MAG: PP2C family protein-serine/threonine phosphatase, partial [Acidobacteriia bacterium]|nr:PP2C family protein-serine/threonine phosphatase [Terriglobia bacterium]